MYRPIWGLCAYTLQYWQGDSDASESVIRAPGDRGWQTFAEQTTQTTEESHTGFPAVNTRYVRIKIEQAGCVAECHADSTCDAATENNLVRAPRSPAPPRPRTSPPKNPARAPAKHRTTTLALPCADGRWWGGLSSAAGKGRRAPGTCRNPRG